MKHEKDRKRVKSSEFNLRIDTCEEKTFNVYTIYIYTYMYIYAYA